MAITVTATDSQGNSSTATVNVTVADNTAPIAIAKDITLTLGANGQASLTAAQVNNGSSDNCGIQSMTIDKTSFDCTHLGTQTVTLTVTDNHGNVSTANSSVTVVDNTAPVIKTNDITVNLWHTVNTLYISIEDNGSGFDLEHLESSGYFGEAGHGIFNMRERASYIGGELTIETAPGKGTKITLTLALDKND